ncbi:MAG: chemotaxis protein CheA [Candidatus Riflebacteria bacterium]
MNQNLELEFLSVFVSESRELIQEVEPQLIQLHQKALQTGEIDSSSVNAIFRLFHSMKGSAASLGLANIASLTHRAETLLDLIREGKIKVENEHVDSLLRALDLTGLFLELVENNHNDHGYDDEKEKIETELEALIDRAENRKKNDKKAGRVKKARIDEKSDETALNPDVPTAIPVKSNDPGRKSIIEQFTEEGSDFLDNAEGLLLELEKGAENPIQKVRELFRGFHSFKGNCGFLGLEMLENMSHKAENILETLFDYELIPAPEHIMTFLIIVDVFRQAMTDLATGGTGEIEGFQAVANLLDQMKQAVENEEKGPKKLGQILIEEGVVTQEQLDAALNRQKSVIGEVLVDMGAVDAQSVEKALIKQTEQNAQVSSISKGVKRSDIRVDLTKLDKLVNLVGELVIAETMVTRNPDLKNLVLENFDKAVHHLRRVTSELQDVALSVRMIPLAMTFQKLVRVVHDLARKQKKKVKLIIVGEETEVDKTMTEQIADPLLHMVRNSIDHGLESTEERIAAGKPETGKVMVEARYEGGEVWIIVSDDGKGLSREKIVNTAIERGLYRGDPANLSDEEAYSFIFEPGFSTNKTVSEISGRGVGMDVVKKNIEKLKGRITVRSRPGLGTSIYLQIPLTLAIIDGMLVRVGEARYTIPLLSIRESIRPLKASITVTPDQQELVRIREELIPVIRLHKLHSKTPDFFNLEEGILVIVEDQGRKAALFIDDILGQQQTVIKGLSNYLTQVKGISGCTILGDGAVSLILDIGGLVEKAGRADRGYFDQEAN